MSKILETLSQVVAEVAAGRIKESHLAAFLSNPHRLLGTLSKRMIRLLPKDERDVRVYDGKVLTTDVNDEGVLKIVWGDIVWETRASAGDRVECVEIYNGHLVASFRGPKGYSLIFRDIDYHFGPYEVDPIHTVRVVDGVPVFHAMKSSRAWVVWGKQEFASYYKCIGQDIIEGDLFILAQETRSSEIAIAWRGKKTPCPDYYRRGSIIDGKPFYEARRDMGQGNTVHWIVWGEWKSKEYAAIHDPRIINGLVFFTAQTITGQFVVVWGELERARDSAVLDATVIDGRLLIEIGAPKPMQTLWDGTALKHKPQNLMQVQLIEGRLLYISETKDGDEIAVWGVQETRSYPAILSVRIHDGQFLLVARTLDNNREYVVWGDWISPAYDEIYGIQTTTLQQISFTARKGRKLLELTYKPHRSGD